MTGLAIVTLKIFLAKGICIIILLYVVCDGNDDGDDQDKRYV